MTPAQLDDLLPVLAVLARSSPKDKNLLVRRLNGEHVLQWGVESAPSSLLPPARDVLFLRP